MTAIERDRDASGRRATVVLATALAISAELLTLGVSETPAVGAPTSSSAVRGSGALTVNGRTVTRSGVIITASKTNESGVLVLNSGVLSLSGVRVRTSGGSSSSDSSSFYGLDAGVLAYVKGTISEKGGSVSTTGAGANAVFAYGSKAKITIAKTAIEATGQYAHGIMGSGGGQVRATSLTVRTYGGSSAPVATDRGGGTITVIGGGFRSSGHNSPGIYSTGAITARNARFVATGAEAAVVEGANSIVARGCVLTGYVNRAVMIYQSMSGDASGSVGRYTQSGGSLTAKAGPAFYVTNTTARIALAKVTIAAKSGVLLNASAGNWGKSGSNGGNAVVRASHQGLVGSIVADKISTVALTLISSSLKGAIDHADTAKRVALDLNDSTWDVTANSHVTKLAHLTISKGTVTNIVGNGHTVYYSKSANSSLDGKTYKLTNGGYLRAA